MIHSIEALHYRSLRYIRQEIGAFQVLVGPNASGKSTFIDVVTFFRDLLENGIAAAVYERTPNFYNLLWMNRGERFELAVELHVPDVRRSRFSESDYERARYEIAVGLDPRGELAILDETLFLVRTPEGKEEAQGYLDVFPAPKVAPSTLVLAEGKKTPPGWKKVVSKKGESGNVYFISETTGWNMPFRIGPQKLGLANLPEDEDRFPVATWVKRFLLEGVHRLMLNSEAIRRPSPPGSPRELQPDGSNLPWAVEELKQADGRAFGRWLEHVRTALPGMREITTVDRMEDRNRYLSVTYDSGLQAPSWMLSDGTLRLLALTLIAYTNGGERLYLIEEPENGIHPAAVETVFQSLASTYGRQVLCASHSPVVLSLAQPEQLLIFDQTEEGETDIVRGDRHPLLHRWKGETDLGTLFAAGVLG